MLMQQKGCKNNSNQNFMLSKIHFIKIFHHHQIALQQFVHFWHLSQTFYKTQQLWLHKQSHKLLKFLALHNHAGRIKATNDKIRQCIEIPVERIYVKMTKFKWTLTGTYIQKNMN